MGDDKREDGKTMEAPPPAIRSAFRNYGRLDDDIRKSGETLKQARRMLKANKGIIIKWMQDSGLTKLCRRSSEGDSNSSIFILVEKDIYVRPTLEQQQAKMTEMIRNGVTDAEEIVKQLKMCAGTRREVRLYRRKPRKSRKKTKKTTDEPRPKKPKKHVTFVEDHE